MKSNQVEMSTLPETNVALENSPPQQESSIPTIHFQGRKNLVSGRVFPTDSVGLRTSTVFFRGDYFGGDQIDPKLDSDVKAMF